MLDIEQLRTAVGTEIERLAEIKPHFMFWAQWLQCNAIEIFRELAGVFVRRVVLSQPI